MANCNLTAVISLDCIDGQSGIQRVWMSTDAVFSSVSYDANQQITGATGTGNFYEFELPRNSASYTENYNISQENGTAFFEQVLTFNLNKMTAAKRNQLLLLAKSRTIKAIFLDQNDNYWVVGKDRGGVTTAGSSVTGTNVGELQGYSGVTVTAQEPEMAYQLDAITSLSGFTITNA